jgi:hypothetical protein
MLSGSDGIRMWFVGGEWETTQWRDTVAVCLLAHLRESSESEDLINAQIFIYMLSNNSFAAITRREECGPSRLNNILKPQLKFE